MSEPRIAPAIIPVSAWRKPLGPEIVSWLLLLALSPLPIVWLFYPLFLLGVPRARALASAIATWAIFLAWLLARERRLQPAGTLAIADGRLRYDARPGAPVDVPTSALRAIVVYRDQRRGFGSAMLVLTLRRGRRILVHEARLRGLRVEEVGAALLAALDEADRSRVGSGSAAAAGRLDRLLAVARVAGILGAVLALVQMILAAVLP